VRSRIVDRSMELVDIGGAAVDCLERRGLIDSLRLDRSSIGVLVTIARLHETYIQDTETAIDARFASLSGSGIAEPYRLQRGTETLAYDLGFQRPRPVMLSQLPAALSLALFDSDLESFSVPPREWYDWLDAQRRDNDFYRFAEYASYADLIPFEASPLDLRSLASIATAASPLGIGVAVAFAVFGSSPLLLVAVPAGMIVCGAAAGVSRALEQGLRHRMLELLTRRSQADIDLSERAIEAQRMEEAAIWARGRLEQERKIQADEALSVREPATQKEEESSDVIGAKPAKEKRSEQAEQRQARAQGS
jgi:hypothetical protein